MSTTALEYLHTLRRREPFYDWLAAFVPPSAGGTDIVNIPQWLLDMMEEAGLGRPTSFREMHDSFDDLRDVARAHYLEIIKELPGDIQGQLRPGDRLAVGTLTSARFNGEVISVPGSEGESKVIVFPYGIMFFPGFCSNLLSIYLTDKFQATFCEAFHDIKHYSQKISERLTRVRRIIANRDAIRGKFTINEVAIQLQSELDLCARLGISGINDFVRDWCPIPLFGKSERFGHPLESGTLIGDFAVRFVILHECGHIVMSETEKGATAPEKELSADRFALTWGIKTAVSLPSRVCTLAGAVLFLELANWIEKLTEAPPSNESHPAATVRIDHIKQCWEKDIRLTPFERSLSEALVNELQHLLGQLWALSSGIRKNQLKHNPLEIIVNGAIDRSSPDDFLDTIPRWLIFGSPDLLCSNLAKLRCQLEDSYSNSKSERDRSCLDLVNQVYAMAKKNPSSRLSDLLLQHYRYQRKQKENNHAI
ncbi:Peptidase U49 [Burkholderia sp. YR290]|nr:Peptidase U49 [Burkholderia sp. YR290]